MSIKTVSLKTAKELKEAGFGQEGIHFYHYAHKKINEYHYRDCQVIGLRNDEAMYPSEHWDRISAPTTDELLEELPKLIKKNDSTSTPEIVDWYFEIKYRDGKWEAGYHWYYYEYMDGFIEKSKSLPEALAQMYLFLAKEGLLNAKRNL